ncbi:MAG: hypothetical protein OHK93_004746 [Ramalina farinacea]|uniref:Uncharacterized protein n=1 Tax=Ramalina farinacea TaxID=258253 RepID=A0AA43U1X0_9LECA|nr:hypothetical protein [Ramalina farinacea]
MKSPPPSTTTPSNLAFSASLSSLLASSAATKPPKNPPTLTRPPTTTSTNAKKDNIFLTHNRNSLKRAAADISTAMPHEQRHATTSEDVSASTLARSRRKMEEKARLYRAMQRGDYVPSHGSTNRETESLIDFDRKYADASSSIPRNPLTAHDDSSSGDDYGSSDNEADTLEVVEYEDELGRTRTGTRATASKVQRQRLAAEYASGELEAASARPARKPENLIVGDTVQHGAFNPDFAQEQAMAELAAKRDRSVTPPEEVRYDASKEVRSKGVGFYNFSRDKEGRERELGELGVERAETERVRGEREEVGEKRRRVREERRREIEEVRRRKEAKKEADRFLDGLDVGGGVGG